MQAGSVAGEEGGPQRVVQMEDEIWGLQEWAWHPPREAEVDSGGWLGGVEAGHTEAWASKPADLARHWLGETEDASEELLHGVQEPGEKASQPRLHGAAGKAPGELAFQRGEHEGSSELGAAGCDTTWICTGTRTATGWRWRLSGLDHVGRAAGLRGSGCPREASAKAGQVAAGERSTR